MAKRQVRPARKGEEDLRTFCVSILARLLKKWDLVIAICGEEGSGKSTLAQIMGWYIDKDYAVKRNTIGSPNVKDVSEMLLGTLPRFSVVILDEAIKVLYKLGWQSQAQILLNTVFSICRAQNKAVLLCMPRFLDFNAYQRQHRIKIWIEVVERGRAFVFMKDPSPFIEDSWHIKANQKMLDRRLKRRKLRNLDKEEFYDALRETKSFVGEFTFLPMEPGMEAEYDALKLEVASSFDVDDVKGLARMYREATKKAVAILYTEVGMTQKVIHEALGVSLYTVNQFLKDENIRPMDKRTKGMSEKTKVIV